MPTPRDRVERADPIDAVAATEGMGRTERLALLSHLLTSSPGRLLALGRLAQSLGVAKSTLSEDLAAVSRALRAAGHGQVESLTGASGGVVYRPSPSEDRTRETVAGLCRELNRGDRRVAGGYLFTSDLVFSPAVAQEVGEVFAGRFWTASPDVVVTVETKGIPLALMTAHALGCPLVTVRRDSRVTEGPALGINYVSGAGRIQTMSLPRRALAAGSRVLLVDDFLKAGGTARGLLDLMDEFAAEVIGLSVLIETAEPARKLVVGQYSLVRLEPAEGGPQVVPAPALFGPVAAPRRAGDASGGGGEAS